MVRPTPVPRLIGVTTSEQSANASRTLERPAQVTAPRVTHRRRVRAVALLDDAHPVINVSRLALNCPIGPDPGVLSPLAQSAQSIIRKVRFGRVLIRERPGGQTVLSIIRISVIGAT